MKLIDYLIANGMSQAEFARELEVHTSTVSYWVSGTNVPSQRMRVKIRRITNGAVTSNDWDEEAFDEAS